MDTPHTVLAAGWIPFAVAIVVVLVFSALYIRVHQHRREKELFSTVASILGLAVALMTSAVVPVDIFLVSFMKNNDGTFKSWADTPEERSAVTDAVLYTYYALYCCVTFFIFFLLPLAYFFYEEGGENQSIALRCCNALKFCIVFVLAAGVLFLVGALVHFREGPHIHNGTVWSNDTEWDRIKNLIIDLKHSEHWENSLSFTISTLSLFGMFAVILYTGYGMSAWPLGLVFGKRSVTSELAETEQRREQLQSEIETLQSRQARLNRRERRRLEELEDQLEVCDRNHRQLQDAQTSWYRKCSKAFRPLQIVLGCLFFCLAALVVISLLITNIDKLLHSLGWKNGYILPERKLPNPIDITLLYAQKVFPLDYILVAGIVLYLFVCSVHGLKAVGIWFCCVKLYAIRWRRTCPQGLLMMCWLLMYMVLAINILLYQVAPQYVMYGNQHFVVNKTDSAGNHTSEIVKCTTKASPSDCTLSRMSMLVIRFCFKFWFFGSMYFWTSWVLILVFVVGVIVGLACKRRSHIERQTEQDLYDSDEELLNP